MKITYTENPLRTTIELDEQEKTLLWHKVKIQELEDVLFSMQYHLSSGQNFDPEKALKCCPDDVLLDNQVTEITDGYIAALQTRHHGDCICAASGCSKCHAEDFLGISTLPPNMGKHSIYRLHTAFTYKDGAEWKERSIKDAIEYLRTYEPTATWEGWEQHAPLWKEQARKAYEYLLEYSQTHFGD